MSVLRLARALIEELSHGTVPMHVPVGQAAISLSSTPMQERGTSGTTGTLDSREHLAARAVAYEERLAMVLEGKDIAESIAHQIATAECGTAIVKLRARLTAYTKDHKAQTFGCDDSEGGT